MRFVIVTGMSGAGKSSVLKMLEDFDYFCVDNLPVALLDKLAQMSWHEENMMSRVAIGIDIRSKRQLNMVPAQLEAIRREGYSYEILLLDCETERLILRYKETRRSHPLGRGGQIEQAIADERTQMKFLRDNADYIIDTSHLLIRDLKQVIKQIFVDNGDYSNFNVTFMSFGFKYGIPKDADLVFDVRFLPNPYYVEELKHQTGNDAAVRDYVMASEDAGIFLDKLYDLLDFLIPRYIQEGKNQLMVAVGCTGGHHRSVTITNAISERMQNGKYSILCQHRDIGRGDR